MRRRQSGYLTLTEAVLTLLLVVLGTLYLLRIGETGAGWSDTSSRAWPAHIG